MGKYYSIAPELIHMNIPENKGNYYLISNEIFEVLAKTCTYNEFKIMMVLIGTKGNCGFRISADYIYEKTGIHQANYVRARSSLEKKGFISYEKYTSITVNFNKITEYLLSN